VPSPVGRRRSLRRVRDGGGTWSPARSIGRPSPSRRRTDRPDISPAVSLASLRRSLAVPCRPEGAAFRTIPLRRSGCDRSAPKPAVASPLRFSCLASPTVCLTDSEELRKPGGATLSRSSRRGGDVARAGHSWLGSSYSARTGPAPGLFSRPGRCRGNPVTGGVHGICSSPFAVLLRPRVARVSAPSSRRARAHLPFRLLVPPRVPSIAGSGCCAGSNGTLSAAAPGFWPRGPAFATWSSLPL